MSHDILIRCDEVSKKFCRDLKTSLWYGAQDIGADFLGRNRDRGEAKPKLRHGEFWANHDVSFELRRGECLGLIGRNGAGKTTLLKMLNGLIKPDHGRIELRGRVGALIALGAGFNPILSGRENVFVNASVLGMSRRETKRRFDEIVDFAELSDCIDSPIRTYSSGMQVRLGFAIASNLEPDILLVDEVLAVGDVTFRKKCYDRLAQLLEQGTSYVLVSHSTSAIANTTQRCLLLDHGRVLNAGSTTDILVQYETLCSRSGDSTSGENSDETYRGDRGVLSFMGVFDENRKKVLTVESGMNCSLRYSIVIDAPIENAYLFVLIRDVGKKIFVYLNSKHENTTFNVPKGTHHLELKMPSLGLLRGHYTIDATFFKNMNECVDYVGEIPLAVESDKIQDKQAYFQTHAWDFQPNIV